MEPHEFWQSIAPADAADAPPYGDRFPARLPDGRILFLPIRPLAGTDTALASLILNQASFGVEAALSEHLVAQLSGLDVEVVVGLPTLGLSLARAVAARLGHDRYVPLGTSEKFWYDRALSVPLSSITSPGAQKRLFLDPRMLPLLVGRRVLVLDDVISTGRSMVAALTLLAGVGVAPVGVGCAMRQTGRSGAVLAPFSVDVRFAFASPLLARAGGGWVVAPGV
ncbi:MAG: phosphoribosyltransferase [Pseudomonadota bacterium]